MPRNENPMFEGVSGRLSGFIYKQINGKTFATKIPKQTEYKRTPKRIAFLGRSQRATEYANNLLKDPAKKIHYTKLAEKMGQPSAYMAAKTEYLQSDRP